MSGIQCSHMAPQETSSKSLATTQTSSLTPVDQSIQANLVLNFDLNERLPNQDGSCRNFDLNLPFSDHEESGNLPSTTSEEAEWEGFDINTTPEHPNEELVMEWLSDDSDAEVEEYSWTDDDSDDDQQPTEETEQPAKKRKLNVLNNYNRANVANKLQQYSSNNILPQGIIQQLAAEYNVSRWIISRILKIVRAQMVAHENINVQNLKTGRVGRKRIQFNPESLKAIPLRKRTSIRAVAAALGIHRSTLARLIKRGKIKKHTNAIKPDLTKEHMIARVKWCLNSINPGNESTLPKFSNMYNVVHVDEKWFCMSKITMRYYLAPDEKHPQRKCKSKRFILKVMFIAAVARPHISEDGEVLFDGKIGIFPFIELVPAKRSSKNRQAGTIETKPVKSVTKDVVRQKLIKDILPTIRAKWPSWGTKQIYIVQDNAKPHISSTDPEFMEEACKDGFDIRLVNQPAQSPDMNILDLGFFRAIQALKDMCAPKTVEKLVKAVEQAYNEYDPKLLNHIFLTLQTCILETLKVKGNNNYHIPHMNKQSLERRGELPENIHVTNELIEECKYWVEHGHEEETEAQQTENISSDDDSDSDDGVEIM